MEGNSLSPPAKRSMHEHKPTGFQSKHSKSPPPPLAIAAGQVAYRLLCHASRVGGVIGKSGTIVKLLEQETGANIRIEGSLPECDDRIIEVIASSSISKSIVLDSASNDVVIVSPAQEALIRVLERILDVAAEKDGVLVAPGGIVSVRLLADTSLIGSLIGRRGKIVDKIRKDTGCKIRIFSGVKVPACASSTEEMVEIEGSVLGVKRALIAVCSRLQDYPSSEKPKTAGNRIEVASLPNPDMQLHSHWRSAIPPTPSNSAGYVSVTHHLSTEIDRLPSLSTKSEQKEVVFKILCSDERVGGVIGKGGTIVRALENETGTSIRCAASVSEVNERLITIAALENAESQYSPAQNATLLVFSRSVEVGIAKGIDSGLGSTVTARILVPCDQVSCLVGRGGEIISGMRRTSGAAINIFASDQVPKGAPENSQIVQISGEFVSVRDALYKVTSRLRASLFPNQPVNDVGTFSEASSEPKVSPYGHTDSSCLSMDKSVGVVNNLSQHTALTQRMDHLGLSQRLDLPPPPNLGVSQIVGSVPGGKRALTAVGSHLHDYPSSEKPKTAGNRAEAASLPNQDMQLHSQRRPAIPPNPCNSAGYVSVTHHIPTEIDRLPNLSTQAEQKEVVFKILCSNERVGGVIGKGGNIVRALENETGTSIRCAAPVSEVNERLITIAALENAESQYSPAQNATLLVFNRSVEVGIARGIDSGLGSTVTARILVPCDQVSFLLGRGGEIISGMRRTSGAAIHIFGSEQVPKGAPENSQIVQISGEFVSVRDALYKVTSRLRASLFPNQIVNDVGTLSDASSEPEVSPYGHRDSASLGMAMSVGVVNNLSQHTALTQRMDHLGLSQQVELPPPPNFAVSQTGGGLESRHPMDIGRGLTSINGGLELGSGSKSAIVTNITVEIVVPKNVLSSIDGENGSNLVLLRQISGAKVMVREPRPGANENIIVISGTPDETQAAQSLLHAFILNGSV